MKPLSTYSDTRSQTSSISGGDHFWVEVGEPDYSGCDVDEEGDDDGDDDRVDDGDADVNIRGDSDDGCHGVCSSSSRPVAKIEKKKIN